jgi:hypothetical protein
MGAIPVLQHVEEDRRHQGEIGSRSTGLTWLALEPVTDKLTTRCPYTTASSWAEADNLGKRSARWLIPTARIERVDVLDGLIHEYRHAA